MSLQCSTVIHRSPSWIGTLWQWCAGDTERSRKSMAMYLGSGTSGIQRGKNGQKAGGAKEVTERAKGKLSLRCCLVHEIYLFIITKKKTYWSFWSYTQTLCFLLSEGTYLGLKRPCFPAWSLSSSQFPSLSASGVGGSAAGGVTARAHTWCTATKGTGVALLQPPSCTSLRPVATLILFSDLPEHRAVPLGITPFPFILLFRTAAMTPGISICVSLPRFY